MQRRVIFWILWSMVIAFTPTLGQSRSVETHELVDIWSSRRYLSEFKHENTKALVLMFMVRPCPVVKLYLPLIKKLEAEYRAKGIQFLAIYSTPHETLNTIAIHGHDHDIAFPLLRDPNNKLADTLGVERSSEIVVLDTQFKTIYQGAIDDQYRAGGRRPTAEKHYLKDALDQLLAGQEVLVPRTLASGCILQRASEEQINADVTYSKDVAPIMQEKCAVCHRPGQVAPFSLLNFEDASMFASMIEEVVNDRRMPPWHAVTDEERFGHFANDRRLTEEEIGILLSWVRSGAKEGDPADLPPPKQWPSEEWNIGKPDAVFEMPAEFQVPAVGEVPYQYYTINPNFDHDVWIQAAEAQPGDYRAVHHINVHITRPNHRDLSGILMLWQLFGRDGSKADPLASFIPGDASKTFPENYGVLLPKGHSLTFEVHYTPFGQETVDRSRVGIIFAKEKPENRLRFHALLTRGFTIPAGDPHFKLQNETSFGKDIEILSLRPHLHKRGKHVRYELVSPDGSRETLLSVPRWDFDWQSSYEFEKPVRVPKGTKVVITTIYDNSANNPNNPDPTQDVQFGLQTWDEMLNGNITYVEID